MLNLIITVVFRGLLLHSQYLSYLQGMRLFILCVNNNNNNLHLYSANLYMNIFGCALQYCYIKFMLKVTKA